jgi:hypothetical protein
MTIYKLYVKTHTITGLKYLGKTANKTPHTYTGSGKYWKSHLKKHGYDVSTIVIRECQSNEEVREWGTYYSTLWNVVESNEWANLKPETGDGVDSVSAKKHAERYYSTITDDQKRLRSKNCSNGQLKRFKNSPETEETKQRKSNAHKGIYKIESPDGREWVTDIGLKEFAETYKFETNVSYWALFNAYRKCYNNVISVRSAKNINHWKVTKVDGKSNS